MSDRYSSPYRWIILLIVIIPYTLVLVHRMSPAVLANDIMTDLQVNAAFMGLLASAYFYPYSLLQIPSGILADKLSPKKLISSSLLCMALGTFIFTIAQSGSTAFIGRLIIGVGCALIVIPSYQALSNWFSKKSYAVILSSVLALAIGLGSMLAGKPLAMLIEAYGWRAPMQGLAVFTIILFFIMLIFFKDSPTLSEEDLALEAKEQENAEKVEQIPLKQALKIIALKPNFWIICYIFAANSTVMFAFIGLWAALYYTEVVGLSHGSMSTLLSIAATLMMFTPILFASVAQKIKSRKNVLIFANFALFIMFLYMIIRNGSFTHTEIYIWGITLSVVTCSPAGFITASLRELFPKNIASTANGLAYSLTMGASAIFQLLIGLIIAYFGYVNELTAQMFIPICILYLITLGIATLLCFKLKEENNQLV